MLPLLKHAADGAEHFSKEAVEALAGVFQLSEEERKRLFPSGKKAPIFYDRVHWALSYLKGAGLMTATRRGYFRITDRGIKVLHQNPKIINNKFLKQFPEFLEYIGTSKEKEDQAVVGVADERSAPELDTTLANARKTPEEILDESYLVIRKDLTQDLLTQVKSSSPEF